MRESHEEVGVRESLTRKLARSQLKWAGHVERMEGEQLAKRADALRVEGRRGRLETSGRTEVGDGGAEKVGGGKKVRPVMEES